MSEINVIGVIGALFIAAFAITVHVVHLINRKNIEIVTGFVQGVPISWDVRWRMLMALQVPVIAFTGAMHLIMAFTFRTIGESVDHADVELLAQVCAWVYLCVACIILLLGPVGLAATWKAAKSYPEGSLAADR